MFLILKNYFKFCFLFLLTTYVQAGEFYLSNAPLTENDTAIFILKSDVANALELEAPGQSIKKNISLPETLITLNIQDAQIKAGFTKIPYVIKSKKKNHYGTLALNIVDRKTLALKRTLKARKKRIQTLKESFDTYNRKADEHVTIFENSMNRFAYDYMQGEGPGKKLHAITAFNHFLESYLKTLERVKTSIETANARLDSDNTKAIKTRQAHVSDEAANKAIQELETLLHNETQYIEFQTENLSLISTHISSPNFDTLKVAKKAPKIGVSVHYKTKKAIQKFKALRKKCLELKADINDINQYRLIQLATLIDNAYLNNEIGLFYE